MRSILALSIGFLLAACGDSDERSGSATFDMSRAALPGKVRVKITVDGETYETSGGSKCNDYAIGDWEVVVPGIDEPIRITCYQESWNTGIVDTSGGPAITVAAVDYQGGGDKKTLAFKSIAFALTGMAVNDVTAAFTAADF